MQKSLEIEFKYKPLVTSEQFDNFCESRSPIHKKIIAGYDFFYSSKNDKHSFYRLRMNAQESELTFKRKLSKKNNFIREEHNIGLHDHTTKEIISSWLHTIGYDPDGLIYKRCNIYRYRDHTLVMYFVGSTEEPFLEIELDESIHWLSRKRAMTRLLELEKQCAVLGANPKARIKESLYEMYRKGKNDHRTNR